jgi:hypothetical protein
MVRLTLHLYEEHSSNYQIRHNMYRIKFFITQTVELVRIDDTTSLEFLRGILGETIAYGIFLYVFIFNTQHPNHLTLKPSLIPFCRPYWYNKTNVFSRQS